MRGSCCAETPHIRFTSSHLCWETEPWAGATYCLRLSATRQDWRVPMACTCGPQVQGQAQQLTRSQASVCHLCRLRTLQHMAASGLAASTRHTGSLVDGAHAAWGSPHITSSLPVCTPKDTRTTKRGGCTGWATTLSGYLARRSTGCSEGSASHSDCRADPTCTQQGWWHHSCVDAGTQTGLGVREDP